MYLIAEIGTNHNGDPVLAEQLVEAAIECGVQAVKMNYWEADLLVDKKATWYSRAKKLELPFSVLEDCSEMCSLNCVDFIVAPWSHELVEDVVLIADKLKIASGEITNTKLLTACRETGLNTILSTGMSDTDEIYRAVCVLDPEIIMHCVSLYPTPIDQVNLNKINLLRNCFPERQIGYSDHTVDNAACIAAYSRGAGILEKHFNIYKNKCIDEEISIHPNATRNLIEELRKIDLMAYGDDKADYVNRSKLRRGESGLRE